MQKVPVRLTSMTLCQAAGDRSTTVRDHPEQAIYDKINARVPVHYHDFVVNDLTESRIRMSPPTIVRPTSQCPDLIGCQ